jgi:hypothetical protein
LDVARDQAMRTEIFDAIHGVMERYDFLVSPTLACTAVENADDGDTKGPAEINGERVEQLIGWCMTYFVNFTGHPAASVPAGLSSDGLPVGMQIMGRRHADVDVLAASATFERLLQGVAELLSPRAHEKGLEIAWAAPAGIGQAVADEGRLRQILLNFAGNAIKFTSRGGVLITVAQTANGLRFTVEDSGPGVSAAAREKIFEAFEQADPDHDRFRYSVEQRAERERAAVLGISRLVRRPVLRPRALAVPRAPQAQCEIAAGIDGCADQESGRQEQAGHRGQQ